MLNPQTLMQFPVDEGKGVLHVTEAVQTSSLSDNSHCEQTDMTKNITLPNLFGGIDLDCLFFIIFNYYSNSPFYTEYSLIF